MAYLEQPLTSDLNIFLSMSENILETLKWMQKAGEGVWLGRHAVLCINFLWQITENWQHIFPFFDSKLNIKECQVGLPYLKQSSLAPKWKNNTLSKISPFHCTLGHQIYSTLLNTGTSRKNFLKKSHPSRLPIGYIILQKMF